MPSIANLAVSISARTHQFSKGLETARRGVSSFSDSIAGIAARAAAALPLAAAGFAAMTLKVAKSAETLGRLSQQTGIAITSLGGLLYGARLAEVSAERLTTSLGLLSKKIVSAATGNATAARAFRAIGVAATTANGAARPTEAVFKDVASAFAALPDGAVKSAIALELFGRSGAALIPFLNEGADGISALQREAIRLGQTFDARTAAAADLLGDNLDRLRGHLGGLQNRAIAPLLPWLADATQALVDFNAEFDPLKGAVGLTTNLFKGLIATGIVVKNTFEIVGDGLRAVLEPLILFTAGRWPAALNALQDNLQAIGSDFRDIGSSIGGLFKGPGSDRDTDLISPNLAAAQTKGGEVLRELGKVSEAVESEIAALEFEAATFGKSALQIGLYKLALQGATAAQLDHAAALHQSIESAKAFNDMEEKAKQVIAETRQPLEKLEERLLELHELKELKLIEKDTFTRAGIQAMQDALKDLAPKARATEFRQIDLARTAIPRGSSGPRTLNFNPQITQTNKILSAIAGHLSRPRPQTAIAV